MGCLFIFNTYLYNRIENPIYKNQILYGGLIHIAEYNHSQSSDIVKSKSCVFFASADFIHVSISLIYT